MHRRGIRSFVIVVMLGAAPGGIQAQEEASPAASPAVEGASVDEAEMVRIPEGDFVMGTNDYESEAPERKVWLDTYRIDKYEVTNRRFAKFVEATGHVTDAEKNGGSWLWSATDQFWVQVPGSDWRHPTGPDSNIEGKDDHPVLNVSWNDATAFCTWAGKRLPTEAEWEKAARGTDGRKYPWGGSAPGEGAFANYSDKQTVALNAPWADESYDDGFLYTSPVGKFPDGASPFGVHDMGGNVWEWCQDWYDPKYYGKAPAKNPPGPSEGEMKALRSGCLISKAEALRAACRYYKKPEMPFLSSGFRCVMSGD